MKKEQKKHMSKRRLAGDELLKLMEAATEDIYYVSEIDSDVYPFVENKNATMRIKNLHKLLNDSKREIVKIDTLRDRVSTLREWQNKKAAKNARRFQKLFQILEENLDNLEVIRIGKVELEVYVVGYDIEGKLGGVWMNAFET